MTSPVHLRPRLGLRNDSDQVAVGDKLAAARLPGRHDERRRQTGADGDQHRLRLRGAPDECGNIGAEVPSAAGPEPHRANLEPSVIRGVEALEGPQGGTGTCKPLLQLRAEVPSRILGEPRVRSDLLKKGREVRRELFA